MNIKILTFLGMVLFALNLDAQNVGIGTNTPNARLHVEGSGTIDDILRVFNDKNNTKDSSIIMKSNGNVGIGTGTPSHKLHVAGTIRIADGTQGLGKVLQSNANGVARWDSIRADDILSNPFPFIPCPEETEEFATGVSPRDVDTEGNYAYVVNNVSNTLQIINISDPDSAVLVGTLALTAKPNSIVVSGTYAYVVNGTNTMQVINISNPAAPTVVSNLTLGTGPVDIKVAGNFAYVINSGSNTMQIINITNPAAPTVASSFTVVSPKSIDVLSNFAYVLTSTALIVINVSNSASPTLAGNAIVNTGSFYVTVRGNLAYVTSSSANTIQIFNISNPAAITTVSNFTIASPMACELVGNYAYVTTSGNLLKVINISNPNSLSFVSEVITNTNPIAIDISGSYAYIVNLVSNNMQIINLNVQCSIDYGISVNPASNEINYIPLHWKRNGPDLYSNIGLGDIGIGTQTPTAKLDVLGAVKAETFISDTIKADNFTIKTTDYETAKFLANPSTPPGIILPSSQMQLIRQGTSGTKWDMVAAFQLGSYAVGANSNTQLDIALNEPNSLNTSVKLLSLRNNGNVGVGSTNPINRLDVEGATAIGVAYAGTYTAPTNGAIIQGNVGIGTTTPVNKLDVEGAVVIGAAYSGTITAPANGAIIQGNVGIGVSPTEKLHVAGNIKSNVVKTDTVNATNFIIETTDFETAKFLPNPVTGPVITPPTTRMQLTRQGTLGTKWDMVAAMQLGSYAAGVNASTQLDFALNNGATTIPNVKVMTLLGNGKVGIGTTSPVAPLDISLASQNYTTSNQNRTFFSVNNTTNLTNNTNTSGDIAVRADGWYWADNGGFVSTSDKRIKDIIGISNNKKDLEDLSKIEITNYTYKDKVTHTDGVQKKVIAQQVNEVFPLAVKLNKGIIPSVYALATNVQHNDNETTIVSPKAHEFIAGDKIRIIIENIGPREVIVTRVDNDKTFSIERTEGANIFIYGKHIDDLLTIDYDALSMLNISATQELYKKIKALEEKTNELSSQNSTLVSQLNAFEAKLQTLESKLSSTVIKQ